MYYRVGAFYRNENSKAIIIQVHDRKEAESWVPRVKAMLYPDEDLKTWERSEAEPSGWIDARDADGRLRGEELYDLRAIPSIYLLDHQKRVVVKDSTDPREVEAALI